MTAIRISDHNVNKSLFECIRNTLKETLETLETP